MTALRWILLVAGLVVIATIYLVGRRNRRTPNNEASATLQESHVPQLDQAVRQSTRIRLRETEQRTGSSDAGLDDLPPMRADGAFEEAPIAAASNGQGHTPMLAYQPSFQDPPTGMTTGAFIAAQAREPVTRKLYDHDADDQSATVAQAAVNQGAASAPAGPAPAPAQEPPMQSASHPAKKPATRKIVALRLAAGSERVEGSRLKSLLEAAGLRHGKYSIYHRPYTDESTLFSVASMVEPGTFDPYAMSGVQFPGVTIFMQLPGPIDGEEIFAQMLSCARELEQGVGGLLQDERGLPLTEQRAQRLREDVANFTHLLGQS